MRWLEDLVWLQEQNLPFVLATLIESEGSTPRETGAKMAITVSETLGTIGGGVLEAAVTERSRLLLQGGQSEIFVFRYPQSGCGGSVKVFLELIIPQRVLWIFGGGHIGNALAKIMAQTPFALKIVEERQETIERFEWPCGVDIVQMQYADAVRLMGSEPYCVVAGFSSYDDRQILSALKGVKWRYLGVLGSRNKSALLRKHLVEIGTLSEQMETFFCPAGVEGIKGKTPGEIAVSIAAQILSQ